MSNKAQNHSSYWMNDEMWDDELNEIDEKDVESVSIQKIARLSATRRAISNFVNILTNKNDIAVRFSSGKESYTTGEEVVIAADDKPENFDTMVGLALHEGSHVLLSDFTFLKAISDVNRQLNYEGTDTFWYNGKINVTLHYNNPNMTAFRAIGHPLLVKMLPKFASISPGFGVTKDEIKYRRMVRRFTTDLMDIMNILEDRRIDQYVYQNAGGYRPYYDAMYTKYFLNRDIGRNLKWNPRWRELTVENYINRLLFFIHPDSSIDSMPGLKKLLEIIDIENISRLAPERRDVSKWHIDPHYDWTPEIWKVASELYIHILRFVAMGKANKQQGQPAQSPQKSQQAGNQSQSSSGSDTSQSESSTSTPQESEECQDMPDKETVMSATQHLPNLDTLPQNYNPSPIDKPDKTAKGKEKPTDINEKRAEKAVNTAKDVIKGTLKKKKASVKEIRAADALEKADARIVSLKGEGIPGGECMVTRKMSDKMFDQDWFIFGDKDKYGYSYRSDGDPRERSLSAGRRMGAILQHRLQVRNDPINTKFTRLQNGNIDKRLLAQLGMDITNVFQKNKIDTFKPAMLHLTLDASGSMNGKKWERVLMVATALAYVGSKVRNIDTVISIRGGVDTPIVCVVYDSRRDQFVKWMKWARRLRANGSTPEGLCYKATMELILECTQTHDVYFINFSDGEPMFSMDYAGNGKKKRRRNWFSYGGDTAINHTRAQINMMRESGVKILSYYITETYKSASQTYNDMTNYSLKNFKKMYGEDAQNVNVENAAEVLRTLNKLLLARG